MLNKGKWILFNTSIIETGTWSGLSIAAKALYIYLRMKAEPDVGDYEDYQNMMEDSGFRSRKYDWLLLNVKEISTNLKIRYRDVKNVIQELEDSGLCMRINKYCMVGLQAMDVDHYLD